MKKIFSIVAAIGLLLASGCATVDKPSVTPERVQSVARLAAYGSATGFLIRSPESRPELEKAKLVLATLVAGQQWDIAQLAGAFQQAGFKELRSQEGILAVTGAILLIDVTAGKTVDLKQNDYAKAAIIGALDGVNLALAGGQ